MEKLENLEKKLKVKFKNKKLLKQALIHSSYLKEHPEEIEDNERLEFLGDAVLNFIVSSLLFRIVKKPEGELTILKTNLVNKKNLFELALELGLDKYLFVSPSVKLKGETKEYLLANAYEALAGSLFLDQGLSAVRKVLEKKMAAKISAIIGSAEGGKNPKNKLQEITQERYKILPIYRVLKEEGPAHQKVFTVGVFLNQKEIARAKEKSKKMAEIKAAEKAIKGFLKNSKP